MTDASYSADASDDAPSADGVDLNRTPMAGDPFSPSTSGYDPSALRIDIYGNPVDRTPYFPDPDNPHLDMGQVLYHMAMGAKPEDFHPAVQPLAQGFSIAFQPKPPMGPGLLGSLDDIRAAIASAPGGTDAPNGDEPDEDADDADASPAAVSQRTALPSAYTKKLDPIVDRYVAEYNQAHGLRPGVTEYLDPDLIRTMIRQEAGTDHSALSHDPMQVNAHTLDWDKPKVALGLKKGVAPGPDLSVRAGIQWLRRKAYVHDTQGRETRFTGWPLAVQKYNGRLPDYSDQVWDHLGEIKAGF
jgi:hypothetical protein